MPVAAPASNKCVISHPRARPQWHVRCFLPRKAMSWIKRELDSIGTPEEMIELTGILVRECGCGCSSRGGKLLAVTPGCFARRALDDRRFVLGVLFGRHLRRQLHAEERTRTQRPQQPS